MLRVKLYEVFRACAVCSGIVNVKDYRIVLIRTTWVFSCLSASVLQHLGEGRSQRILPQHLLENVTRDPSSPV